jgi:predicted nucleic acid-binding protein
MILVDANVLMYAGGGEHPNKAIAEQFLLRVAGNEIEAAIDAEVLQEILHRYISTRRWALGKHVYSVARTLFPTVLPITAAFVDQASDAVHAAVVRVYNLEGICTFDRDVDNLSRIVACPPVPRNGNTPANTPRAGAGPVSARFTKNSARRTSRSNYLCFADS